MTLESFYRQYISGQYDTRVIICDCRAFTRFETVSYIFFFDALLSFGPALAFLLFMFACELYFQFNYVLLFMFVFFKIEMIVSLKGTYKQLSNIDNRRN